MRVAEGPQRKSIDYSNIREVVSYPAARNNVSPACQPSESCGRFVLSVRSSHGLATNPYSCRIFATRCDICFLYSSGAYPFFAYHSSYCLASFGNFSRTKGRNCLADDGIRNSTLEKNHCAPAFFAAAATASDSPSRSVIPGTSGQADTPAASPASRNCFTAANRKSGRGARGSSNRASLGRSVVTVMLSDNSDRSAIFLNKSMSRTIC